MKKRICVLLLLVFSLVGLASCDEPYSKVSMTITGDGLSAQNEIVLAMQEEVGGALSPKNSVRLSVKVDAPSSLSDDIVLPTFGDRYGDEYVEIELVKEKSGSYSLVFKGVKSGETTIPIKTKDGNITQIIKVTIQLGVTSIQFKEGAELLVKPGDTVDLSALNKKYISYTPATTEQTEVTYSISYDYQGENIQKYINDNKITLVNNVLTIDESVPAGGDETIKLIAISTQKNSNNEEISTGTNRFLKVKIINAYNFADSLSASIKNKSITAKGYSISGNSINYELVLANPIVPSDETIEGDSVEYIFGGELMFVNKNSEYKIFLSDVNSDIVSINSSGVEYDTNNKTTKYKYQIMPKELGTETFTFKICYIGEKDTGEYDDNFTKYIHLTVIVKDLPTESNLLLNDTKASDFGKLMVFEEYANDGGAKLTIYDPKALDMTFTIDIQGLLGYSDEKCTQQIDVSKYVGNNGDTIYIKASSGADPVITITMSSKFFVEYNSQSNISGGFTYSKNVVVEAYIIKSESAWEFNNASDGVIEIKIDGNSKLSPQLIAFYNDESVDMKQVVTSYSSSNMRSGSVSFGTGKDKNEIYFTPNFKLQYDFYVSDTDLTFYLQNGTQKKVRIDVELNYITKDNAPILWFDFDTSNSGYLASWNGGDVLTPQADFSKLALSNQGEYEKEGENTYNFAQFNYLILATNSEIKFNVYRLCLFDGSIIKISSNEDIYFNIGTNAGANIRWQNINGDGIIRTKDSVSTFNGNKCVYTTINISLTDSTSIIMTLNVAVFDKVSSVGLKQNSFSLFDGANLKIADIDNCFAEIELNIKSVSGSEKLANNGNLALGNLYSAFSLVDPDETLFSITGETSVSREKYELVDRASKTTNDEDKTITYTTVNKKLEKVNYEGHDYYSDGDKWYDSLVNAYSKTNDIDDTEEADLITALNKITNSVEVVVFKFITNAGPGEDIEKILSYIYKDGYVDFVFEGTVNQFNNSFANCNFTVRLYNPSKVSSIKTSVNQEMGLYYEVGNSNNKGVSNSNKFSYNILPASAFNTDVFVQIAKISGNTETPQAINFQLFENGSYVEKGVFDTPQDYLNGKEYYYTIDGVSWYTAYNKDQTCSESDKVTDSALVAVLNTLNKTEISTTIKRVCYTDFIVRVKPSSSTASLSSIEIIYNGTTAGNFYCRVIALDSVGDGSDYINDGFNIYVADGSEDFKYQIRNRAGFNSFLEKTTNNTGTKSVPKYYVLATDIVLTNSFVNTNYQLNDNLSGLFETSTSDANNVLQKVTYKYSIYGVSIASTEIITSTEIYDVGLFASIGRDGLQLDYVSIENAYVFVDVSGNVQLNVGILFGKIDKQININNCKISGSIEINAYAKEELVKEELVNVGGFAGEINNANAFIKGVPSESSINNSDINSNVNITVTRRYEKDSTPTHSTYAGGVAGRVVTGNIEETNVISQIKVVEQQYIIVDGEKTVVKNQDNKVIEDFDSKAEVGGVVGHIESALVKQVVVYPVIAGYKRVGGLAGFVKDGEFKDNQVQLLYNINMRNVIAGYSEVGGLFGEIELSKDMSIDFCYVRSYSNKEIKRCDCNAVDIYNEIKNNYYGGIVLINKIGDTQALGGFVGKISLDTDISTSSLTAGTPTLKITNSYLYTDISSSAVTTREKVAGFVGVLGSITRKVPEGEKEVDKSFSAKINATDCYIDCDININGTFKVSYGNVTTTPDAIQYGTESSYAYKTIGNTTLSEKGDYSILKETVTTKLINTITEDFSVVTSDNINAYSKFENVYVKIGDDQFGITGSSDKNKFSYSTLSTKITETYILLIYSGKNSEEKHEYYVSAHKSENDGLTNEYFEFAVDEDASSVLTSMTTNGINDVMGYGFMTNKKLFAKKYTLDTSTLDTSDSANWITALKTIISPDEETSSGEETGSDKETIEKLVTTAKPEIKVGGKTYSIYRNGGVQFVSNGTNWYSAISSVAYDTGESQNDVTAIGGINTKNGVYQYGTTGSGDDAIYCVKVGKLWHQITEITLNDKVESSVVYGDIVTHIQKNSAEFKFVADTDVSKKDRYTWFEIKVGDNVYYINENSTTVLKSDIASAGTTELDYPWVIKTPAREVLDLADEKLELDDEYKPKSEITPLTYTADADSTIYKLEDDVVINGKTITKMVWYATKQNSASSYYGWMLAYVNDENLAYIINGELASDKSSSTEFDTVVKITNSKSFLYNSSSIKGPYYIDGKQVITTAADDENANKLSYYKEKATFVAMLTWSNSQITIEGNDYTLDDGMLKDEDGIEISLTDTENNAIYITREITIGETQNKLDSNKYVKIYNSLYGKDCSSVEEMYKDSGFKSFDGEIKKLFGDAKTYYVVRTTDTATKTYSDIYYESITLEGEITDEGLIAQLEADRKALFGGTDYYVSAPSTIYYTDGEDWYTTDELDVKVTDDKLIEELEKLTKTPTTDSEGNDCYLVTYGKIYYSNGTKWYTTLGGTQRYYNGKNFSETTANDMVNTITNGVDVGSITFGTYVYVSSESFEKTINVTLKDAEWKWRDNNGTEIAITDEYLIDYFDSNRYSADNFTAYKSGDKWYTDITLSNEVTDSELITTLNGLTKTTIITLNGITYSSVTNDVVYYTDGTKWYTTLSGEITDSALLKALNEEYENDKTKATTQSITIYKQVKWYKDDAYSLPVSDSIVTKELSGYEGLTTLTRRYYFKDSVWYSDSAHKHLVGESDVVDELEKLDKVFEGELCYVEYTHVYYGKVILSTVINVLDEDIITENIDFAGTDIVSSYNLIMYLAPEKDADGNDIWTYDNKYQHVISDENILNLSNNISQNNVVFKFGYNDNNGYKEFDVTVSDGGINISNTENLGDVSDNSTYIKDEKIYITRVVKGGGDKTSLVTSSYMLTSSEDSYKWLISDKVNGGMPTIVRAYINNVGTGYEQGYMLWFDTLANLTLSVNEFVKNGSNEYYVIDSSDGKQHQGHITNGSNSVILMYNEAVDGTQTDSTINQYSLSYGVTESGYFIATINGKVMELTGVKIDKDSASQIVVLSSDSSIVSVTSSNVSDNYITLTVNQLGSADITFYNLKDDGISVKLHIDIVRGFTSFVVADESGAKVDSNINLNIDEYAFYSFGYENVLNGKAYIANSSGYRVTVESVDSSQIGTSDSSSILFNGTLINGESIGKSYDFDYSNNAGLLALNKNDKGGTIVLKLSPYIIVDGKMIVVEGLEKTITINISSAANLVEFAENHTMLMAGNTKEITLVVLSNNKAGKQSINLIVSGGDISGTITVTLNPSDSLPKVLNDLKLLNIKWKSYSFEAGVNTSGNAIINKHYFTLVVGLDKAYYLEKYDTGISPFSTYLEYQIMAEDVVSGGKNSTFDLTLAPNEIDRIDGYFYPSLSLDKNDAYKQVSVKAVATGQTGIYKISLSPEYNNVLAVDVIFDSRYSDLIEVAQVKPSTIITDDNSIEFTELGVSKPNTYIGNVLTLWNELIDYNALNSDADKDYSKYYLYTQGEYFIRIQFKDAIPENVEFAIDIVAYDYSRNVIMTKSDSILIDPKPKLNILSDGQARGVVAKGEYLPFVITAHNVTSDISISITTQSGAPVAGFTLNGNIYSLNENGKYVAVKNIDKLEANKTYYLNTSNLSYGMYKLNVSGEKAINYVTYKAENELTFTVAVFTLEGISENEANDGVVTVKKGVYKVLTAKLKVNDLASNLGDDDPVAKEIEALQQTISGFEEDSLISNWYVNTSSGWDRIGLENVESKKQYNTFVASRDGDNVVLRARSLGSVSLRLSVHFYYDEDGKIGIDWTNDLYHVETKDGATYSYLVDILEYTFTFTVEDNSTEDHPNPIYNQSDLEQLSVADGNYILYDDIELIDWKPIDFNALYLDGNGFTIKIKSFDLSDEKGSQEAYVGIFRTISENSTIKNLNIDIYPLLMSTSEANSTLNGNRTPNIDLRETEQVTFGVLAGENLGVIENVKVVNCSLTEKVLFVSTTRGYYQVGDDYNSVSARIGGLVGVNSGVIADSMVGVRSNKAIQISRRESENSTEIVVSSISISAFSIWGGNNIAGLTATNGGTISNSFVSDLTINNTTRVSEGALTAGFVGSNTGKIYSCACTSTNIVDFRAYSTKIKSSTTTAGFVHTNAENGVVEDCYTNVGITNNNIATAGFVYENLGSIVNAYTTSKNDAIINNSYSSSHGLFVYVKPMSGTIKNCYYVIVDDEYGLGADIDTELLKTLDPAIGINIKKDDIPQTTMFDGFTFASSSDALDGVWYISNGKLPTLVNCEDIEIYTARTLVSAPAIYFKIENDTVTQYDLSKNAGETSGLSGKTFIYGGITFTYNATNNKVTYNDVDGVERTITKDSDGYYYYPGGDQYEYEYTKNNPGTLYNPLLISSAEEFNKYIVTYTQKYVTKNTAGEVIKTEYIFGGKLKTSDSNDTTAKYVKVIQDLDFSDKTILTKHKISGGTDKISIADVVFNGTLIGNSMTLSNIYLVNENKNATTNWGIFSQIGLDDNNNSSAFVFNLKLNYREVSSENSARVGVLAGTIVNSTIAKIEITGPGQNNDKDVVRGKYFVGGLAGYIGEGSKISEIYASDINVSAGYVTVTVIDESNTGGDSFTLTSAYAPTDTTYSNFKWEDENKTSHELKLSEKELTGDGDVTSLTNISYAGAIAGAVEGVTPSTITEINAAWNIYKTSDADPTYATVRKASNIYNISVSGNVNISGMVAGGLFGYAGEKGKTNKQLILKDLYFELDKTADQNIYGRAYSGGLVGYLYNSAIVEGRVEHEQSVQDDIDININTVNASNISNNNLFANTLSGASVQNIAIGGLVGYSNDGIIIDSYSKVNVVNTSSLIAGGLVGQAKNKLYIAFSYTTGNVNASLMVGGLIGYKLFDDGVKMEEGADTTGYIEIEGKYYKNDLYLYNVIALNVWDSSIFDTIKTNAKYFDNDETYSQTMQEIGNYNVGFNSSTSVSETFKYLGSLIGRVSVIAESEEPNNITKNTAMDIVLSSLSKITRTETVAGQSDEEFYYTYFNDNYFNVISSTYGKVKHSGSMNLDNYSSVIDGDKLTPSSVMIGKQYYISYITGDFINNYKLEGYNSHYINEFSSNVGFVYDSSNLEKSGYFDVYDLEKNEFKEKAYKDITPKVSTVWYVESNTYLPKHGYNYSSNTEEIYDGDALKTALTYGYSDKVYRLNGLNKDKDNADAVFDSYTLTKESEKEINLSNCTFIYTQTISGSLKPAKKFTLTINLTDGYEMYNVLNGCSFENFKFVITCSAEQLKSFNTSGYGGLFANEMSGCTFINCEFEFKPEAVTLSANILSFGMLAGRANRVVVTGSTITLPSSLTINSQNNNAFASAGAVFGVLRNSTLSKATTNGKTIDKDNKETTTNDVTVTYNLKTNNSGLYVGGLVGYLDSSNVTTLNSNLTVKTNITTINTITNKNGGLAIGGLFGFITTSSLNGATSTINLTSNTFALGAKAETIMIGGLTGRVESSTMTDVTLTSTINYTHSKNEQIETLNIGGLAGRSSGNTISTVVLKNVVEENEVTAGKLTYTAGADNSKLKNVNIGGVIGESELDTLDGIQNGLAITINPTRYYNTICSNILIVGGIIGSSSGNTNTIANSYNFADITIMDLIGNKSYIGGIIGYSQKVIMNNVISYGDIIHTDKESIKQYKFGSNTYYIDVKDGTIYLNVDEAGLINTLNNVQSANVLKKVDGTEVGKSVTYNGQTYYYQNSNKKWYTSYNETKNEFSDLLVKTLIDELEQGTAKDLKDKDDENKSVGKSVAYNGQTFYYNNSESKWYTGYTETKNEFSNPLSDWASNAVELENDHITFGGIIGYAHSKATSSTFTNVLSMTNFISSDANGNNKVLSSVRGFAYNLSLKKSSGTQMMTNSYFVAEFDPAGASDVSWAGYALPYAEIGNFIADSNKEIVANGKDYFPIISTASSEITSGVITNANIADTGKKLNPNIGIPDSNVDARTYYIYLDNASVAEAVEWTKTINIGLGAVVTTSQTAGNTYFQIKINSSGVDNPKIYPIETNNGVISNFLFDYVGSGRTVASTTETFLGMNKNNGYILNCLFSTYQYDAKKDGKTFKTAGITLTTPDHKLEEDKAKEYEASCKVSIININNGGIYKTGSAIKFVEGSTVYENQSLSFMTIENNGTISESYTISSFDGSCKGNESVNVKYGALAVTNNGVINHCLVAGHVVETYHDSSNVYYGKNNGKLSNMVYSKTGSCNDLTSTGFNIEKYSNIWDFNGSGQLNDGYPYIRNGKRLDYSDFGAEKVNIYSVQTLKNFLTYLNAFPEKGGEVKHIQSYQTITFKITSGGPIDKTFTLYNDGTITGSIKGLTIKNSLVTTNKGTISYLTLESCKVVSTSENISKVGLVCKTNNGTIESITAKSCDVGSSNNPVTGGAIIAYENISGKTISGVTISGCRLYGTTTSYTSTVANLGLVTAINNGKISGKISINKQGTTKSTISGSGHYVGLFVGNNQGTISDITEINISNSTITVGAQRVGGLIGNNGSELGKSTQITLDSVNVEIKNDTEQAISSLYVGGVFGWTRYLNAGKITSSGTVTIKSVNSNTTINLGGVSGRFSTETDYGKTVGTEISCSNSIVATEKNAQSYNYSIGGIFGHCKSGVTLTNTVKFLGSINCSSYLDKELCAMEDGIYTVVHEDIKYLSIKEMFSQVNVSEKHYHKDDIQQFCMFSFNDMSLGWFTGGKLSSNFNSNEKFELGEKAKVSNAYDKAVVIHFREKMNGKSDFLYDGSGSYEWYQNNFIRFEAYEYSFDKSQYMGNGKANNASWQMEGTRGYFEDKYEDYAKSIVSLKYNQNNLNNMWAWWYSYQYATSNYYGDIYTYHVLQYTLEGDKILFKGLPFAICDTINSSNWLGVIDDYSLQKISGIDNYHSSGSYYYRLNYFSAMYNNFILKSKYRTKWNTIISDTMTQMSKIGSERLEQLPIWVEYVQKYGINAWTPFRDMEEQTDKLHQYIDVGYIAGTVTLYTNGYPKY